jgi:hypothetical protein
MFLAFNKTELSCNSIWDGWSCHGETQAGTTSKIRCPSHMVEDTCNSILDYAYFECNQQGKWFENEWGEFADYAGCSLSTIPVCLFVYFWANAGCCHLFQKAPFIRKQLNEILIFNIS